MAQVKYETNKGNLFFVVQNDEDLPTSLTGSPPSGAATENMTLKISKNNNQAGGSPRYIRYARKVGEDGYTDGHLKKGGKLYKDVIFVTKSAWDAVQTGNIGQSGVGNFTHRGATYWAAKKVDERFS